MCTKTDGTTDVGNVERSMDCAITAEQVNLPSRLNRGKTCLCSTFRAFAQPIADLGRHPPSLFTKLPSLGVHTSSVLLEVIRYRPFPPILWKPRTLSGIRVDRCFVLHGLIVDGITAE
jgi:hypothetical protein